MKTPATGLAALAVAAVLLTVQHPAGAQQQAPPPPAAAAPPAPYGAPIGFDAAGRAMAAAEDEAKRNGWGWRSPSSTAAATW